MGKFMPTFIHDGAASTKSKRHNPWKIKTKKNKKNSSLKKKCVNAPEFLEQST